MKYMELGNELPNENDILHPLNRIVWYGSEIGIGIPKDVIESYPKLKKLKEYCRDCSSVVFIP